MKKPMKKKPSMGKGVGKPGKDSNAMRHMAAVKGVCWNKGSGKWQAGIKVRGKSLHLGLFDDIDAAAAAYQQAAAHHFGQFARPA